MSRRSTTATLHLLATSEGGRSGPLTSGYRSLLRFEGSDTDFGFELELDPDVADGALAPGTSGSAQLSFWATDQMPPLVPGRKFELREGTRVIGHGSILPPRPRSGNGFPGSSQG